MRTLLTVSMLLLATPWLNLVAAQQIDTIYHNGSILTMVGDQPTYAEALAIGNGKILFVGEEDEVMDRKTAQTRVVDRGGQYENHFKIGAVKITLDGSPQGRTAFFTTPYLQRGPVGEQNWRGEPTFPQDLAKQMVKPR